MNFHLFYLTFNYFNFQSFSSCSSYVRLFGDLRGPESFPLCAMLNSLYFHSIICSFLTKHVYYLLLHHYYSKSLLLAVFFDNILYEFTVLVMFELHKTFFLWHRFLKNFLIWSYISFYIFTFFTPAHSFINVIYIFIASIFLFTISI